jgi:hypothetical protein
MTLIPGLKLGSTVAETKFAVAAQGWIERAGVVCDHPLDPGATERIAALRWVF